MAEARARSARSPSRTGDVLQTRFRSARATAAAWIERAVDEESLPRLTRFELDAAVHPAAGGAALARGRGSAAEALGAKPRGGD